MDSVTWYVVTALLIFNLIASVLALRDDNYPLAMRRRQVFFIWLLPVIGAILVLAFRESPVAHRPAGEGGTEEAWDEDAESPWVPISSYLYDLVNGKIDVDATCANDSGSSGDCGGDGGGGGD